MVPSLARRANKTVVFLGEAMPDTFDVVFRGGGIKGVAFIGALEKLTAARHRVRRMIGTSVGAIFATSFAAGYTPQEMLKEIEKRDESGNLILAGFVARPLIGLSNAGAAIDWSSVLTAAL
jgi:predicted acylesterase/phospholipase RssA